MNTQNSRRRLFGTWTNCRILIAQGRHICSENFFRRNFLRLHLTNLPLLRTPRFPKAMSWRGDGAGGIRRRKRMCRQCWRKIYRTIYAIPPKKLQKKSFRANMRERATSNARKYSVSYPLSSVSIGQNLLHFLVFAPTVGTIRGSRKWRRSNFGSAVACATGKWQIANRKLPIKILSPTFTATTPAPMSFKQVIAQNEQR